MKTRIGIAGYGNLGRGVEFAVAQNPDTELVAVFTRRNPETVKIQTEGVKVYPIAEAASHKDEIDVLILCGGSARLEIRRSVSQHGPRCSRRSRTLCRDSESKGLHSGKIRD